MILTKIIVTPDGQEELPLTDAEIAQYNIDADNAIAQQQIMAWKAYQAQAQALLDETDMVSLRCFKAGVVFPTTWLSYVQALRAIMSAQTGDPTQTFPTKPTYPTGT